MFRSASLFIGTSFTVAVFTIFATSNVDSALGIPHKNIFNAKNFNPHKKLISLLNVPICTQGMQRTWSPEAGTIIVTGPYSFQMRQFILIILHMSIDNTLNCEVLEFFCDVLYRPSCKISWLPVSVVHHPHCKHLCFWKGKLCVYQNYFGSHLLGNCLTHCDLALVLLER